MKQRCYIGDDAIVKWLDEVQTISPKHCFLVRGHGSFMSCGGKQIMDKFQQLTNCRVTEFEDFSANPKYDEALCGVEKMLDSDADIIVAVGGGSVIDMAKLIRHIVAEKGRKVQLHALPTTAGTGAEATHFAVAYIEGKKQSISADDILPDVAVVYPQLTYGNNEYLTACTGFDALAQAIESYWAKGATSESREYSCKALKLLWNQLPLLLQSPSKQLRDQVAEGAYWAGRAINISTTTAPHAFSYIFTSKYGYPHGHAVALTFPFFMKRNGTQELFELLGLTTDNIIQRMEEYIKSLGLAIKLPASVDVVAALQAVNLQRLANNPITVTPDIIADLEAYLEAKKI